MFLKILTICSTMSSPFALSKGLPSFRQKAKHSGLPSSFSVLFFFHHHFLLIDDKGGAEFVHSIKAATVHLMIMDKPDVDKSQRSLFCSGNKWEKKPCWVPIPNLERQIVKNHCTKIKCCRLC